MCKFTVACKISQNAAWVFLRKNGLKNKKLTLVKIITAITTSFPF